MYATAKAKEGTKFLPNSLTTVAMPVQSNLLTDLRASLRLEQQSALVSVSVDQRGIVIALDDRTCFRPGQANLEPTAVPMFGKVAGILGRYDNRILLEGHTDSVPIHTAQFHSNWELSTARSITVMELMAGAGGIQTERFLIGGSADNAPVHSNKTEEGRAHNRRVEIIILDNASSVGVSVGHSIADPTTMVK